MTRSSRVMRIAHLQVSYALSKGTLCKQPCEKCGRPAEAHHDDYLKPLHVRWLCGTCHRTWPLQNGRGLNADALPPLRKVRKRDRKYCVPAKFSAEECRSLTLAAQREGKSLSEWARTTLLLRAAALGQ